MNLETLVKEFNDAFDKPFLPEGFATMRELKGGILSVHIGDRDAEFNLEGERVASGRNLGSGIRWEIKKKGDMPSYREYMADAKKAAKK